MSPDHLYNEVAGGLWSPHRASHTEPGVLSVLAHVEGLLTSLTTQVEGLTHRVNDLEYKTQYTLGPAVETLRSDLQDRSIEVTGLGNTLRDTNGFIRELQARASRIEDDIDVQVDALHEEIKELWKAVEE